MIWLPIVLRLPIEKYDWVFVDEAQDLNKSQLELVHNLVNETGRVCCVGDRHQSIYGFRGADVDAIPRLIRELNEVKVLPLTVSWRCPSSVVGLAQQLVPQFQAAPDAPEGTIEEQVSEYKLVQADAAGAGQRYDPVPDQCSSGQSVLFTDQAGQEGHHRRT
jgi:superfamily I DNA/RNA helicase